MPTLREVCLKEARDINRELAATVDMWIEEERVEPDEIPHILIQVAKINDLLLQAMEPASDVELTADLILHGARDAILDEAIGGC